MFKVFPTLEPVLKRSRVSTMIWAVTFSHCTCAAAQH